MEQSGEIQPPGIDALFALACGCVLDGCSDSSPGRAVFGPHDWWTNQGLEPPAADPNGWMLMCTKTPGHGWQMVTDALSMAAHPGSYQPHDSACNGLCVMASDLVEGIAGVAYPHDGCPLHSPLADLDLEDHSGGPDD